jgi:RNA polymerase sigma factor for flagellar operon FliA
MSSLAIKKLKKYNQAASDNENGLTPEKREALIIKYAPLVKTIAGRMSLRLPSHIGQDDLLSAGIMGLLDAVDKYKEEKGVAFKSYAEFRIRGAILDELRAMDWVPRSVRKNAKILESAYARVENEKMGPATDEEVAEELGMDMEAFHHLLDQARGIALISEEDLGQLIPVGGSSFPWAKTKNGEGIRTPLDAVDFGEVKGVVAKAIDKLPKNEKTVISLYYYEELTMKEIGEVMSYTESRISQLHTKAVIRLRNGLRGYFMSDN